MRFLPVSNNRKLHRSYIRSHPCSGNDVVSNGLDGGPLRSRHHMPCAMYFDESIVFAKVMVAVREIQPEVFLGVMPNEDVSYRAADDEVDALSLPEKDLD